MTSHIGIEGLNHMWQRQEFNPWRHEFLIIWCSLFMALENNHQKQVFFALSYDLVINAPLAELDIPLQSLLSVTLMGLLKTFSRESSGRLTHVPRRVQLAIVCTWQYSRICSTLQEVRSGSEKGSLSRSYLGCKWEPYSVPVHAPPRVLLLSSRSWVAW
jgi:hypothetical protein